MLRQAVGKGEKEPDVQRVGGISKTGETADANGQIRDCFRARKEDVGESGYGKEGAGDF